MEKEIKKPLYQIYFQDLTRTNSAVSKAPEDIANIASKIGFNKVVINVKYRGVKNKLFALKMTIKTIIEWLSLFGKIKANSVVLIQIPVGGSWIRDIVLKGLKKRKNVKYISLFHDVELLRHGVKDEKQNKFFNFICDISDQMIVHNSQMFRWFVSQGVKEDKLVSLEIFDYIFLPKDRNINFDKTVIIAGNLDLKKTKYLKELGKLNIPFRLFGLNYNNSISSDTVVYKGLFSPEELPYKLDGSFGLIWDGDSVDTCSGDFGNYLKYNNPHKLSLYLASGFPVFIWKYAAEAKFVEENGVGFTIEKIADITQILDSLTEAQYVELKNRVQTVSKKLVSGYYTKRALEKSLENL